MIFSIWGRLLRADLILVWKSLNNKSKSLTGLFTLSHNSRTRGHPFKLPTLRSNTDIRRRFFTNRVTTVWNNLSSATVMSSSIEIFKSNLPKDLGDLLYFYYDWYSLCCLHFLCSGIYLSILQPVSFHTNKCFLVGCDFATYSYIYADFTT